MAQTEAPARPGWLPWLMLGAIAANVFAIVTVNYWIYHARAAFIAAHPDYVAVQPPTISRAISDPAIGEPFAFWITVSAIVLVPGVLGISIAYARLARDLPDRAAQAARLLVWLAIGIPVFQAASSVGMYLLSSYRFPDHNDTHMLGSYLFFVAQAGVIALFALLASTALISHAAMARMEATGQARRGWVRLRCWLAWASVALTVAYLVLFQIKTMDLGAANATVYAAYVLTEPAVISSFLLALALMQTDLWAVARSRSGS